MLTPVSAGSSYYSSSVDTPWFLDQTFGASKHDRGGSSALFHLSNTGNARIIQDLPLACAGTTDMS